MAQADYTPGETHGGLRPRRGEWLRGQNQAFRAALDGAPLAVSLGILGDTARVAMGEGVSCAFYMADAAGETLHHVVGMPEGYARRVEGCRIGTDALVCGLTVGIAEPVFTPDVRLEPRWAPWAGLAEEYGYRGCWSFPVETAAGELVGTFALYLPEPRMARPEDLELAEMLSGSAAIVIAQHRSREALGESEEQYRLLFHAIDDGYCIIEMLHDAGGRPVDYRFLEVNPAFERHTGLVNAAGRRIRELAPRHEEHWFEIYGEIARTGRPRRFELPAVALGFWYDVYAFRVGKPSQRRVAILFADISERKRAEEALRESETRSSLLLGELQHRVRNILFVIRSVFTRTLETGGAADEIAEHFRGRLDALARTQVVVTQTPLGTADLENLVREELLSVSVGDGPRLSLHGPEVELSGETAQALGLVVHELTTNSLKYGALRFPEGGLAIRWTVNADYDDAPHLVFSWEEQGVPAMPTAPGREGFGTELITRALPYRLGAETSFELRPGGVRCLIDLPLRGTAPSRGAN